MPDKGRGLSREDIAKAAVLAWTDEQIATTQQVIVEACLMVHPRVSHHPCGDCSGSLLAISVAREQAGPSVIERLHAARAAAKEVRDV